VDQVQAHRIEHLLHLLKVVLLRCVEDTSDEQSSEGSLSRIVGALDFAALALFLAQFHRGLKAIDLQAQGAIEFPQLPQRGLANEAIIADNLADNRTVLLLHKALVVALARSAAGQGELFALTVGGQLDSDELVAIIRVNPQQGEGQHVSGVGERGDDLILVAVNQGEAFRPSGGDIR
jgi:hypothetical protein